MGKTAKQAPYPYNHVAAVRHLRQCDANLGDLIARAGRYRLPLDGAASPYEGLLESIVHQQLHGKAAATIFRRLKERAGEGSIPTPAQIAAASDETLRGAGLSRQKLAAIRDLAEKAASGVVPELAVARKLSDEELIQRLTAVRGVGAWTVHMLLIFRLGRPDVLPTLDLGVQQGYAITYRKRSPPKPKELAAAGERWRPYRSVASWYLWQAVQLHREAKAKAKGGAQ